MGEFVLPADDADLLLFLDRFRVMLLKWSDVLGIGSEECRSVEYDYVLLSRVLTPFHRHAAEMSERYGPYAAPTTIRGSLPCIRERLIFLIRYIEAHPAYTREIAVDLRLVTELTSREWSFCSGNAAASSNILTTRNHASS
jgi:hypothetical protein